LKIAAVRGTYEKDTTKETIKPTRCPSVPHNLFIVEPLDQIDSELTYNLSERTAENEKRTLTTATV
jgi:hypothetical protein